jgi:hypothetical protein
MTLLLPRRPETADDLEAVVREALSRAAPGRGGDVALDGVEGEPPKPMTVGRARLTARLVQLTDLPTASQLNGHGERLRGAGNGGPGIACHIRRVTIQTGRVLVQDFACRDLRVEADDVHASIGDTDNGVGLRLLSAARLSAVADIAAEDVRDYILARAPWITSGEVRFGAGGAVTAEGRVRIGLFPIGGRIAGRLAIRGGDTVCLEDVSVTVAGRRLGDALVREQLRSANPVFTVAPLRDAGLAVTLAEPEARDESTLVVRGWAGE